MRNYELLLIFKPTLTEEELKNKVDSMKELITKNGGEIASLLEMGTRKLAYLVNKHERGVYYVFYFKAPTTSIKELERVIRINEDIVKFMTIKFEGKKEVASWDKLVNKSLNKDVEPTKTKKPETKETVASEPVAKECQTTEAKECETVETTEATTSEVKVEE